MLEFPRWKYVLILIVVLLSVLYALPNMYQKDPSVQITRNRPAAVVDEALSQRVQGLLKDAGITPRSVALEGSQLLVRLPDAGTQTRAADVLRPALQTQRLVHIAFVGDLAGFQTGRVDHRRQPPDLSR